jgi:hypothetical protein
MVSIKTNTMILLTEMPSTEIAMEMVMEIATVMLLTEMLTETSLTETVN